MKLYSTYEKASTSMVEDLSFVECLLQLPHTHILETGTFRGEGSTQMLAYLKPQVLITIERDKENHRIASENLVKFPFIQCLHGLSVNKKEAVDFIKQDEAISNHEAYPDVWIDDIKDPVKFYTKEMNGTLFSKGAKEKVEEDWIRRLLPLMADFHPMILLDSAGGIGLLEFQIVREIMGDRSYTVIFDDTHHLKHFRSRQLVLDSPDFQLMYEGDGCIVSRHEIAVPKRVYVITGRIGDIHM